MPYLAANPVKTGLLVPEIQAVAGLQNTLQSAHLTTSTDYQTFIHSACTTPMLQPI